MGVTVRRLGGRSRKEVEECMRDVENGRTHYTCFRIIWCKVEILDYTNKTCFGMSDGSPVVARDGVQAR